MITHSISLIGKRNANEDQHDIIINSNNLNKNYNQMNFINI